MITEIHAFENQVADILFDLEEIIVADRPFSINDYRDEIEDGSYSSELTPASLYQNVGSHRISPLNEY